ncbi:helix-turn-helix transcriptional regulator [Bacillus subtilis]|nr:helix-turn-helix transcriptional regulator [Bacillus subtilis]WGD73482.1 helix-turn-helix transcriptional regulator [Bacillus subtilis]WGD90594.1 helix-turn-helix transcriptional regulator [Bacillus subtilis]
MNLVDLIIARKTETLEERTEGINRARKRKWTDEGIRLLAWRERLGLTRTFVSKETGVNYSRLRRLELGCPVKDAKIIYRIYEMTLEKFETNIEHERLLEQLRLLQNHC